MALHVDYKLLWCIFCGWAVIDVFHPPPVNYKRHRTDCVSVSNQTLCLFKPLMCCVLGVDHIEGRGRPTSHLEGTESPAAEVRTGAQGQKTSVLCHQQCKCQYKTFINVASQCVSNGYLKMPWSTGSVLSVFYSIWGTLVMLSPCTGEYMSNFLTRSTSGSMFESVAGNHEASPCIQWGTCLTLLVRIQLVKKIREGFALGWTLIMWLESNVDKQISVFPHLWCVSRARTCSKISLPRWLKVTLKWKSTSSVFYMCITYLTCVTCPVCMPHQLYMYNWTTYRWVFAILY